VPALRNRSFIHWSGDLLVRYVAGRTELIFLYSLTTITVIKYRDRVPTIAIK